MQLAMTIEILAGWHKCCRDALDPDLWAGNYRWVTHATSPRERACSAACIVQAPPTRMPGAISSITMAARSTNGVDTGSSRTPMPRK